MTRLLAPRVPLRDSGIPWLGEIPAHWAATRLKFVADVQGGLTLGKNYGAATLMEYPYLRVANVQDGYLDLSDIATILVPETEAGSCLLKAGDVLMNEGGDADKLGRGCIWAGEIAPCLHQNHVFAVRPRLVSSEWLNAWTSTEIAKAFFESRAKQSTNLASISATNIKELPIPVPPADEQSTIVDYLDQETARLDGLVAAKERLLGLVAEKRWALITHAVTRGLDSCAPLRNSGLPWLGEIPVHWRVAGFTKYLRSLVDYRGKTPEKTPFGVFLVTARNIRDGRIDYEASQEFVHMDAYEEAMRRGKPTIGDLLLTTEAPLGQAALVDRTDIALAQRVIKLDYDSTVVLNEFVLLCIRSALFQWQLNSLATGSTALGIKGERLHMLYNLLPPVDEQRAIIAHIAAETAKLDALRTATERTIALLKERRAALITAAVTGQIEVEGAV